MIKTAVLNVSSKVRSENTVGAFFFFRRSRSVAHSHTASHRAPRARYIQPGPQAGRRCSSTTSTASPKKTVNFSLK